MAQTHARIPRRLSRRIPPRNPYRRPSLLPAILSSQTPHPFHLRHALPISSHGVASGQKRGGGGDFEGGGEEVRGRGGGGAAEEIGGEEGGGDEGEFLVAVLVEYFGLSSGRLVGILNSHLDFLFGFVCRIFAVVNWVQREGYVDLDI